MCWDETLLNRSDFRESHWLNATAIRILDDPLVARYWWLLPVEDLASFVTWVLGFFGNTIMWRGRKLILARDGTLET